MGVAAGMDHSLGLKADGSIEAWGWNGEGQCDVPEPNEDFMAIAAGAYHSMGLRSDGSIVAWGGNDDGQCNPPGQNRDFVAIAAGARHSLGLASSGKIWAWGWDYWGQCMVPNPEEEFVAIGAGGGHSLGLKPDGSVVAWGSDLFCQLHLPERNEDFIAIAGGYAHSIAIRVSSVTDAEMREPRDAPDTAKLAIRALSPNPFNPSVTISFEIRAADRVTMEIYDVSGRRVTLVPLGYKEPGLHIARWDGRDLRGNTVRSGVYFVRLRGASGESQAVKAVLLR